MSWRVLLRWLPRDMREPIAGDIDEEAARLGRVRGALWSWWTVLCVVAAFRWETLVHGRGLPPIGEELRSRASVWDAIRQDVTYGARMLRRQPAFTAVALLALALGIGANTAIFSIVDAVLWRPLPYPAAQELVSIGEQRTREFRPHGPVAPADFYDWRRDNRSFSAMAAVEPMAVNLSGGAEPERIRGIIVTAGFFDVIGIKPAIGRDFTRDEETPGRHRVALLSDGLWRRRFGADPSLVGRKIVINQEPFDVIGILPPSFWWAAKTDFVAVYPLPGAPPRVLHSMDVVARLKAGVSFDQARGDMEAIGKHLSEQYPDSNATHSPHLFRLQQAMVGEIRPALLVLLGAVGLVLLIACANVAMLLLAKATGRQREIAVRFAVGAARSRVVRQLLTESVMLACAGGAVGVLVAAWGLTLFQTLAPASFSMLPGIAAIHVDVRVLVFALAASMATGLVFGVIPAIAASDQRIAAAIQEEGRGGSSSARVGRTRAALVVSELALSLVLLTGAALLLVSFKHVLDVSPGFEPQNVVIAPILRVGKPAQAAAFYDAVLERVRALPTVTAAAVGAPPPFTALDGRAAFGIEGRTNESPIAVRARPRLISPGYFATMGIPLLKGRTFTDRDVDGAPDVVIMNATAAKRYWPNEDPIGHRITFFPNDRWLEIVGIVGDVKHAGLEVDTDPEAYMSNHQTHFTPMSVRLNLVVRTGAPLATIAPMLRTIVAELDPNQPIGVISSMEDLISESVAPRRLNMWLVGAFASVALALTAAGLYGVMSFLVAQRTREIGVRMALGASPRQVLALVMRQAGRLTVVGIVVGVAGALALTRSMTTLLFGIGPADPWVYGGVSLLLAIVALIAVAVPSSRATRVDPISALRDA